MDRGRFVIGSGNVVGPDLGTDCGGLGVLTVDHTLTGNAAQDTIFLGGRVRVSDCRIGGQYSTSTGGGGVPITVRIRDVTGNADGPSVTMHYEMRCESAMSFTSVTDMDFGTIDVPGMGPTSFANLGTNGNMTYAGGLSGAATGIPGAIVIAGVENNVVLEVFCDTTATLTNTAGSTIQVTDIEGDPEDGRGNFGTGSDCNGISGAAAFSFSYNGTSRNEIFFGGRINGGTAVNFSGGVHSTTNPGGNNLEVVVSVQ